MPDEIIPQTTLRETLETNIDAAEAGTLPTIDEAAADTRARDEAGRFARKEADAAVTTPTQAKAPVAPQAQLDPLTALRPTTWKKEYLPLWDKAATGRPLTKDEWKKLAEYNGQRENEYKTGVSTYKAEATAAKELQEAITPFLPELQANNIAPAAWIKQLGQAHYALAKGNPELKLQVFRELARQYNVPLGAVLQNPEQVPPIVNDLLGQIQALKEQVSGVTTWRQQQETTSLTSEIAKYANDKVNYPYFEAVRGTMAQLLETGLAQDIPSAYPKAIWMQDDVREAEKLRLSQASQQTNVVVKARANAVSPKSATPSGQVTNAKAKDIRSGLEDAFEQVSGRV
jgi:hypothetical protein